MWATWASGSTGSTVSRPACRCTCRRRRDDCVLHLSEHHGDACPGAALRIATEDLDDLHRELQQKRYGYAHATIEAMPWGSRDMSLRDPFGNRLTFTDSVGG